MRNDCLGFPIKKGRLKMRIAKKIYRNMRVAGLVDFKFSDYNRYDWKVGDIANDCDGFNWKIAKIVPSYHTPYGFKRGKVLCDVTFVKEDETYFCHVSPAESYKNVVDFWERLKTDKSEWNFAGNLIERYGNFTINLDGTIKRD